MLLENTVMSLSRDLNLVQKKPTAENAHSASTEVGRIVSSQLYTVYRHLPRSSAWAAEQRYFG